MLSGKSLPSLLLLSAMALGLSACGGSNNNGGGVFVPPAGVPGDSIALTSDGRLITFNRATPGVTNTRVVLAGLNIGDVLVGVDFRPATGVLYGLGSSGALYAIDTTSGVASQVMHAGAPVSVSVPLSGTVFGVDFNPVPDRLRVVSDTNQNLRVNVDTGAAVVDGALTAPNITAAAYTNNYGAACRTTLYYIDTTTGQFYTTSAPNDGVLTAVGTPNGPFGNLSAFDIRTASDGSNSATAVLTVSGTPTLFTVNLQTGVFTSQGTVGGASAGATILGLSSAPLSSAPPQAAGDVYGLTETNGLVSFNRSAPAKLCTAAPITGLNAGENLLGIDFRPANGNLVGVTSTARILTIDPATGAGSFVADLAAAASDTSAPYSGLNGTSFGLDFNPVPDRLRLVSDLGQNLRINVDTGETITDGDLNGAAQSADAAGYTNSVQGTGTTRLFVINSATDQLYLQNPPNDGTLVAMGGLGLDFSTVSGFDVDGRDNTALLAGSAEGATTSSLYNVDLITGAATLAAGPIGGGERLRGLARPTPVTTVFGLDAGNQLVRVSMNDPAAATVVGAITGLGAENLVGIDVRPLDGLLYGVGDANGLFVIDPVSAAASRVNLSQVLDGSWFGVDFNPVPNALRIVSDNEQNLRVTAVGTGATTVDGPLARDISNSTFSVAGVAYTNSLAPAPTSTTLYALDANSDSLVAINPPNDGVIRVIGPTGFPVNAGATLEIIGPATATQPGTALGFFGPGNRVLYSVNLLTGASAVIGTVGTADNIVGFSAALNDAAPAADSILFAVTSAGNLISFARNAPGTLLTNLPVTGLMAGDSIVGIDVRAPSNTMFALTNNSGTGRLYLLNPFTGEATALDTLSTALTGTSFATNFNPVADRLRIVSDTGQNLRVNVDNGLAIIDGPVNQPPPDVHAAAYANSFFPAPATTTLYVMDMATGSLLQQNPANAGTLFNIGALSASASFTRSSGFDVAGGDNGIALAALQLISGGSPETQSRLYRINLSSGAASEVIPGVLIGGAELRGLAIQIR